MKKYQKCDACNKFKVADNFKRVRIIINKEKRQEKWHWWCEDCYNLANKSKDDDKNIKVDSKNIKELLNSGTISLKK